MLNLSTVIGIRRVLVLVAAALAGSTASAAAPDSAVAPWLGKEITITVSTLGDHIPIGGKFTLIYDGEDDVVRICARSVPSKRATWRMDLAIPCNVALNFVRGERYCTDEDVKAGDAEVLAGCHRLRSHDVALHPAAASRDAVELHDVIVFLLAPTGAQKEVALLLDSPSRVTHNGLIHGSS
jgi:hypothetical protein